MNKLKIIILFLGVALFSVPGFVVAAADSVNVGAMVPSRVSKPKSSIVLNASETLADPANHSILLTIYLKDEFGNPLPNLNVEITSNRGDIDILGILTGADQGKTQSKTAKGRTNDEGMISFKITSFMPGDVTLKIVADTLIEFDPITVKFLPLPFPANVTISLPIPFSKNSWKIYDTPVMAGGNMTPVEIQAKQLANTGMKVEIPFWPLLIVGIWLFSAPFFVIMNFYTLRRSRQTEKREVELLEKIAKHEDLVKLREDLRAKYGR